MAAVYEPRGRVALSDVALAAALSLAGCSIALLGSAPLSTRLVAAVALPTVTLPVVWRRVAPLACAVALSVGAVVSGVPSLDQSRCGVAIPAALLVLFAAASRLGGRAAIASLALTLAAVAFLARTDPDVELSALFFFVPLCVCVYAAGRLARSHWRLALALESSRVELAATRSDAERLALELERARLTSGIDAPLRAALGRIAAAAEGVDPHDAMEAFVRIEGIARAALGDLREMLRYLRDDLDAQAGTSGAHDATARHALLERSRRLSAPRHWSIALSVPLAIGGAIELALDGSAQLAPSALLFVAICVAITLQERRPAWGAVVAGAVLAASSAVGHVDYPLALIVVVVVLAFSCGAHARPVRGAVAALVLVAGAEAAALTSGGAWVPLLVAAVAPFVAGRVVRRRRKLVDELGTLNGALLAEHARIRELTVRRERTRVARELHDAVAHHLTVIVLQAGAGRLTGVHDGLARIRTSGALALADIDVIGAVISPGSEAAGMASVRAAIDQAREAGVELHATVADDEVLPVETELLAYRVVQEGLTNAIRHAPGARVDVLLEVGKGCMRIEVVNTLPTVRAAPAEPGSGSGLRGLRSRIEASGGTLEHAVTDERGWRLRASVPVCPGSAPDGPGRMASTPAGGAHVRHRG